MKRKLSLLLAVVMILGSFSFAFAEDVNEAANFLEEKGVLVGDTTGDLMLGEALERRDSVVLLSRLMGVEEEAKSFEAEGLPTWEDNNDSYYNGFLAWAQANEYFKGHSDVKFGPRDNITAREYAVVLLRALEYVEEAEAWDEVYETAKELGLLEGVEKEADEEVTRGEMALMTYAALETALKDSEETLAEKLGIEMPEVPGATEVKDVRADNLKEIIVEFDGPVEKESATKITNYKLDGQSLTRASVAVLDEDESTVVIQLRAAHELKNQREYKLTVSNVNSANESTVINDTVAFRPLDVKVPEVENVDSLGNRMIRVTFSEPVTKATAEARANYKLNGYVPNGKISLASNLRTVSIKLASPMKDGENKLSVASVEDYAGMKIVNVYDRVFEVVEDKTAPESFEVLDATLEGATIRFNEPVDPDSIKNYNVYWLDANGRKMTAEYVVEIEYDTYYIGFSTRNKLPASETTLYVEKVTDFSGNQAAKLSAVVAAEVDTKRPELTSVDVARHWETDEYLDSNKLDLTFNKSVDIATMKGANRYNVTVKDDRGKVAAVAKDANVKHRVYFPTTVTVELSNKLTEGKVYTVEVKNVTDTTYLKNMMIPVIETVVVPNISAPTISAAYQDPDNKTKLHVVFNKEMAMGGEGSALDLDKYMIKVDGKWQLLPRNTEIEPGYDNKSVIVKFEEATAVQFVRVTLVEDAFGNKISGLTQEEEVVEPVEAKIEKVELVAKDKIAITFDKQLIYADSDSFRVNGAKVGVDYTVNSAGKGVVNLELDDDVYTNKDLTVTVTKAKSEDVIGLPIEEGTFTKDTEVAIRDKVAPVVVLDKEDYPVYKDNYDAEGYLQTVEIEYVEDLKIIDNISPVTAANDFVIYGDYDNVYSQLTAGVDYEADVVGANVVITFKTVEEVKEVSIETAKTTKYITDMSGNSIEEVAIDIDLTSKAGIGPKAAEDKAKADEEAAEAVVEKINDLPAVDEITADNLEEVKAAVAAANEAYEALTEEQKALVGEEVLAKIGEVKAKIAELEEPVVEEPTVVLTAVKHALNADYTVTETSVEGATKYTITTLVGEGEAAVPTESVITPIGETVSGAVNETVTVKVYNEAEELLHTFENVPTGLSL